jgi:beta-glucosidase
VQSKSFEVEGGTYDIMIGASCQDIRLRATFSVKGTGKQNPYASIPTDSYKNCQIMDVPDREFQALLGRKLPVHTWDKSKPLELNDTVRQLFYAKNPVARLLYKILTGKVNKAIENGKPDLNLLFIYNIPFRGMAKMMGGMVSMQMAEDMLLMCNGHWHKGLVRLIHHYFHRPQLESQKKAKKA